ncbi:glycoside hydrolase family 19 protein [Hymenobacter sp. UYP22]|uniref:glycoside hydrolase family 19 protein n=1 Tax=Hymenobacter sp. UYP22 TaxID=3156348 RepID=UPI00339277C1
MIVRANFFASVRATLFGGTLSQEHVTNIEGILDCALEQNVPVQQIAYILATTYHETAHTMRPLKEYGLGKNYDYGKMLDMGKGPGRRVAYTQPPQLYYGRGYVQLTWLTNYLGAGKRLGIDLAGNPDEALKPDVAAKILVHGMVQGWFTGRKLSSYFNPLTANPVEARRIVNGTDKAALIAGYHAKFLFALTC